MSKGKYGKVLIIWTVPIFPSISTSWPNFVAVIAISELSNLFYIFLFTKIFKNNHSLFHIISLNRQQIASSTRLNYIFNASWTGHRNTSSTHLQHVLSLLQDVLKMRFASSTRLEHVLIRSKPFGWGGLQKVFKPLFKPPLSHL